MVEFCYKQDKNSIQKLRSRAHTDWKKVGMSFIDVFSEVFEHSKDFRGALNQLSPGLHPLDETLSDWDQRKFFKKKRGPLYLSKKISQLANLCKKLKSEYQQEFLIEYSRAEGKTSLQFIYRTLPIFGLYKVKGESIERIEASDKIRRDAVSVETTPGSNIGVDLENTRLDEIEIKDLNSPSSKSGNALTDGLAVMSRITPTLVKYINREGNKKLLVSIPEYLDPTTFLKGYGKMLSKIHHDFYRKTYKGRPKEMSHQLSLLKEIWMEKCRDKEKPLSANRQSEILSSELRKKHNIELAPITITRWYLPHIRKEVRQKIANN